MHSLCGEDHLGHGCGKQKTTTTFSLWERQNVTAPVTGSVRLSVDFTFGSCDSTVLLRP